MKNLNIGARLALGFAAVLCLLIAVSVFAIVRMNSASVMTDNLVSDQVYNERLLAEWRQVVEVNAARTTAAYLAVDPAEQATVEAEMKKASAYATETQNKLTAALNEPERTTSANRAKRFRSSIVKCSLTKLSQSTDLRGRGVLRIVAARSSLLQF